MNTLTSFLSRATTLVAVTIATTTAAYAQVELENPLGGTITVDGVLANIIGVFLGVVGGVAVFIFVYGGFMMMISAGNPERVKKGQSAMVWAALGLIVIFGSYGITQFIFQLIAG